MTTYTLAKKQAIWLRKALPRTQCDKRIKPVLCNIQVNKMDGKNYAVATDGFVLHVTPTDAEVGVYALGKDGTLTSLPNEETRQWMHIAPATNQLRTEQVIASQKRDDWKSKAGDANRVRIDTDTPYTVDWRYYVAATSYDKRCIQRLPHGTSRPCRFDYQDGSFAVVMPMCPEGYSYWPK